MHPPEVIAELEKNQAAYDAVKDQMEAEHWGRTVLLHDGNVVAIYNDEGDAYDIGCENSAWDTSVSIALDDSP